MLYCAYGSNMSLDQMNYRCPNSNVIGNGKLIGWKLVFNVHLDIVQTDDEKSEVPVVVWNIDDNDWAMLDRYEGYPHYYTKDIVNVIMDNGENISAIIYVMVDERKGICPPFNQYFNTVLDGYKANGINTDVLYDALEYSIDNETEYNQYNTKKG